MANRQDSVAMLAMFQWSRSNLQGLKHFALLSFRQTWTQERDGIRAKQDLSDLHKIVFFRLMCGKLFFPAQTQDINTGENPELRPQSEQVLGDVDSGDCFFNCVSDIHLTRRALLTSISRYRQYGIGMSFEFWPLSLSAFQHVPAFEWFPGVNFT